MSQNFSLAHTSQGRIQRRKEFSTRMEPVPIESSEEVDWDNRLTLQKIPTWWFQRFFIFTLIWGNDPI